MARRSSADWSHLRWLIVRSLRGLPGFSEDLQVDGKLVTRSDGIYHHNYLFAVGKRSLVLRMPARFRPQRSHEESIESLALEAETLRGLGRCDFAFSAPRLICIVNGEEHETIGMIESGVEGAPLSLFQTAEQTEFQLKTIAEVAAAVHQLPRAEFQHLKPCADSGCHIDAELKALPVSFFADWPLATMARDWIMAHRPQRPSAFLHGDLLPQNLLWDFTGNGPIGVIDWECARIGDPAYDLAIVTRGARKPLKASGGFVRLLSCYNEAAATPLTASDVRNHELLLHLRWLAEAARDQAAGKLQGHGPDYYAQQLASLVRRLGG